MQSWVVQGETFLSLGLGRVRVWLLGRCGLEGDSE